MNKLKNITKEQIIIAIKSAQTLVDVCRKLDINNSGGNRRSLREFILINNIDISHFKKNLTKEEYEKNPKCCQNCGNILDWEHHTNTFCSSSCAASFNNKNRVTVKSFENKNNKVILKEQRLCKNCGNSLNNNQEFYCSMNCKNEFEQKEYIFRWKQGLEDGLKGEYGISNRIRRYLFNKTNNCCEICGWSKVNLFTKTIPLEIHHIDGDYMNNCEENLQVLCPNCHSLTETYKSHNKNGRKEREKYYFN